MVTPGGFLTPVWLDPWGPAASRQEQGQQDVLPGGEEHAQDAQHRHGRCLRLQALQGTRPALHQPLCPLLSPPSLAQRSDKLLTPKPPTATKGGVPLDGMRWGELSQPLLRVPSRWDISSPWRAVPLGISQGPFPPRETEAQTSALLHPRVEDQRALDGGTEGTAAEPPKLIPHAPPAPGDRQNKAGGGSAPCTQGGDSP